MLTREEWRRQRRRKRNIRLAAYLAALVAILIFIILGIKAIIGAVTSDDGVIKKTDGGRKIEERLLTVSDASRPKLNMNKVNGIVLHYVGKKGVSAIADRNYYERLHILNEGADKHSYSSVHFIVGITGEIVQCIPTIEVAYASKDRNGDTIAIEYCHDDEGGVPTDAAYKALVDLTATLCKKYELSEKEVLRHYDVSGVECPIYFTENQDKWDAFIQAVSEELKK